MDNDFISKAELEKFKSSNLNLKKKKKLKSLMKQILIQRK